MKDADIVMSTGEMQKGMLTVRLWLRRKNFDLPVRTNKNGSFKIPDGTLVYTCFTSDFLLKMQMRGELRHGK